MNKKSILGLIIGIFVVSILLGIFFFNNYEKLDYKSQKISDNGDFIFEKQPFSNTGYESINGVVSVFERRLSNELNKDFNLPYDIYIKFKHCNTPNVYYSSQDKAIIYCYEMLEDSFDLVREVTNSTSLLPYEKGEMVTGITFFFFYHELAHALIDAYDLPVLGKEEDAADFFAILIIFSIMEELEYPSYGLSGPMTLFAKESEIYTYTSDLKFWDSHSIPEQRIYSILCLLYEKYDPNVFPEGFIGSKTHERLEECNLGVDKISESWSTLIRPYLKPDSAFLSKFD